MSPDENHGPIYDVPLLLDLGEVPGMTIPLPAPCTLRAPTEGRREPALFEIGVVYRKRSHLYLAVSSSTLITFLAGEPREVRPVGSYDAARSMSVKELCRAWGITLERLDRVAEKYVAPSADGVTPSAGRSRRRNSVEELVGLVLRKVRIAA